MKDAKEKLCILFIIVVVICMLMFAKMLIDLKIFSWCKNKGPEAFDNHPVCKYYKDF